VGGVRRCSAHRGAGGASTPFGREELLHFVGGLKRMGRSIKVTIGLTSAALNGNKAPLPNPHGHFGYKVNNATKFYVIGGQHLLRWGALTKRRPLLWSLN